MPFAARRIRAGFTIAECLVAVTILAVGLLGLAGTALAVERLSDAAARRAAASALAWARLERLRATPCAARAAGSTPGPGIRETWTAVAASGVTYVEDSLHLPPESGRAAPDIALGTVLPC